MDLSRDKKCEAYAREGPTQFAGQLYPTSNLKVLRYVTMY